MLINGIHHVCIKCRKDQVEKVKEFYTEVLGLPVVRSWGEPELAGFVFDSGAGLIEVFTNAQEDLPQGSIRHFAFATSDVDQCVKAVREAGYAITVEPKDVTLATTPPSPIRVSSPSGRAATSSSSRAARIAAASFSALALGSPSRRLARNVSRKRWTS